MLAEGQKKAAEEKLREAEQERVGGPGPAQRNASFNLLFGKT